jgi:hypothetical protein
MKKEILAVSISLILFLISISGCIETSQDKEPKMVYVDGIWDIPHNFTWNNRDRFPLVNPVDI